MNNNEATESMSSLFSPGVADLHESLIRSFDEEIATIPNVIRLTLGEPDFPTSSRVKEAAIQSIKANRSHYAPNAGTWKLREAISGYLSRRRRLQYKPEQIVVTEGASEGLTSALGLFLAPDTTLIYPSPAFGVYAAQAIQHGARCLSIDTTSTGFELDPGILEQTLSTCEASHPGRPIILVLNYPNNPTGAVPSRERIRALASVISRYKSVAVVSDEVYAEISYEKRATSIAEFIPEQAIIVDSASKTFAMTGWRLGYCAVPPAVMDKLTAVHQTNVATGATMVMDAATEAYNNGDSYIDSMVSEYQARRDKFIAGLHEAKFNVEPPSGSFYIYARIPTDEIGSSLDYARRMASQAHVACVPGDAFEVNSKYIRFSYAVDAANLDEAISRLGKWNS